MIGGVFAGLTAIHLYGDHAKWIDPLMPWGDKHHDKSVSGHNQVCGTTTHSLTSNHPVARSFSHSLSHWLTHPTHLIKKSFVPGLCDLLWHHRHRLL